MWSEWRGPRRGWSRRTKITTFVVAAAIAVAWGIGIGYLQDRASGATPSDPATGASRQCVPPGDRAGSCEAWARKQVRKFRKGRTGDSAGAHAELMAKKKWNRLMRAAVKKYKDRHPDQFRGEARDWDDWCSVCDYFFNAERCMATGLHPAGCAEAREDSEEIHRLGRKLSWFTLKCGGGALIGGAASRSPAGAIFGGVLACGWGEAADLAERCHPTSTPVEAREPVC